MSETLCNGCGQNHVEDGTLCSECQKAQELSPRQKRTRGWLVFAAGCSMPFVFVALGYAFLWFAYDHRGGSGLLLVFPLGFGLILGIVLAVSGLVTVLRNSPASR